MVGQLPHGLRADLARAHTEGLRAEDGGGRRRRNSGRGRARLRVLARAVPSCGRLAEIPPSLGAPGGRALGGAGGPVRAPTARPAVRPARVPAQRPRPAPKATPLSPLP